MKKIVKILSLSIFAIVIACAVSLLLDRSSYTNWQIKSPSFSENDPASWAKFQWTNDTLAGKYFEKTAMFIPCKIDGIKNPVTFQFDLGADLTGVYENTFRSFFAESPQQQSKITRFRSPLQFWNNKKCLEDLSIHFGNYAAQNQTAFLYRNYGEIADVKNNDDTIHMGSIGADIFKNKILIIDYPNERFAICESVPPGYADHLVDIELDKHGRIILPMKIHGKNYRIMFDNGSSLFPLMTGVKNMSNFSSSNDVDTIEVSSWGKKHNVTGKIITDNFELAGQQFNNVKIYANHSGRGIDPDTDGMAGNALFWNKTIVIDFANKKFGAR